jgi:hypothetical protein
MNISILKDDEQEPIETDPGKLGEWLAEEIKFKESFDQDDYFDGKFHRLEVEVIVAALICLAGWKK